MAMPKVSSTTGNESLYRRAVLQRGVETLDMEEKWER